jgi:hypothetical protein
MEENMRALVAYTMSRSVSAAIVGAWIAVGVPASACANVITDWDEKALVVVTPMASLGGTSPYMAERMMGMVHAAMFDAVNSIERRYRPYLVQLPVDPTTSKESAAAAAAAAVLATIDPMTAVEMKVSVATYLASIPDGAAKSDGVKLGEAVAARIVAARMNDGSDAPDDYRPRTTPGVYVPTAITLSSMWPKMKPFAIAAPSQFRPVPPILLESKEWATERLWRTDQCKANGPADRDCPVLARRSSRRVSPLRARVRDRKADERRRQRAVHDTCCGWAQRRDHRCVGRQVLLQLLAADHRNSQR